MDHDDYVRFMWDACSLVARATARRPIVWEEAGVAKLPEGTRRPALVRRRARARAAAQGLPLIMSPAPHTYLDQKYDESTELGLTWAGAVEVRDAYEWDPARVIEGADVLGVEAALWSETTETPRRRRLHGLPAPARGGRGRLVAAGATGRTSARAWPPTAGC